MVKSSFVRSFLVDDGNGEVIARRSSLVDDGMLKSSLIDRLSSTARILKSSLVDRLSSTVGMLKSSLVDPISSTARILKSSLVDRLSSTAGMVKSWLERSRRRKPSRWRVMAEGSCGGKGRGQCWSKMTSRSTIIEDEEMTDVWHNYMSMAHHRLISSVTRR